SLFRAWQIALACDPVSAFGGVLICNGKIEEDTAAEINKLFFEVLIASEDSDEALRVLTAKKNRIILKRKEVVLPQKHFKTLLNDIIQQDKDNAMENAAQMECVTKRQPGEIELSDLECATKIVKHTKSHTSVLVTDCQLQATGVGPTTRDCALLHRIEKDKSFKADLRFTQMASVAFFPYHD